MLKLSLFLFLGFGSFLTVGCGGDTSNSMVGDSRPVESCPTGGCADLTPKLTNTYISILEPNIIIDSTQDRLDVSGQCSSSTFKDNEIDLYFQYTTVNSPTPILVQNCKVIPLSASPLTGKLSCVDGRFHASVGLLGTGTASCLPPSISSGRSYSLVVQLSLKNSSVDQQAQKNEATGKYMVPLTRN